MGKALIVRGADYSANKIRKVVFGEWLFDCTLENSDTKSGGAGAWFLDGSARDAIRGETVEKVKINAFSAGTISLILVNFADSSTHIPVSKSTIMQISVAQGINEYELPSPVTIGNNQSIGLEATNNNFFMFSLNNGGEPFTSYINATEAVEFPDSNFNLGVFAG